MDRPNDVTDVVRNGLERKMKMKMEMKKTDDFCP